MQWRETVSTAVIGGRSMPDDVYHEFRYVDLMRQPGVVVSRLVDFLQVDNSSSVIEAFTARVDPGRADVWRAELPEERLARFEGVLRPTLDWLGYD